MSLIPNYTLIPLNDVEISPEEMKCIEAFLQGAVYAYCNKFTTQEFMLKDLIGERNYFWQGTPLFVLYKKCENKKNPVFAAGQIAGKILKNILINDKRTFNVRKDPSTQKNIYSWDGVCVQP